MRKRIQTYSSLFFLAFLAVVARPVAPACAAEHPAFANWSKFPVGTRVTIRSVTQIKGKTTADVTTTTILAQKDEKAVVIRKSFRVAGEPEPHPDDFVETKIGRDFPDLPGAKSLNPEHSAEESRIIERLGRKFVARLHESRGTTEAGTLTTRTWTSPDMPGQIVGSVSEVKAVGKVTTEDVVAIEIPGRK